VIMKISIKETAEHGGALLYTMVAVSTGLIILAGAMAWSGASGKQVDRANAYMASVAAAEAATETTISRISTDFLYGGESQVLANVASYRQAVPTPTDSSYWSNWQFSDGAGNVNSTYVQVSSSTNYVVLDSTYAGLKGFVTTCALISNARQPGALNEVTGGVYQQLQLARIPIFQFAMYTSGDMEIGNGQPFVITGRVHSNGQLYVEPITNLTFQSDVSAVGDILYAREPLDSRSAPYGVVTYMGRKDAHVNAMTLPIGMTNTPQAVREITQPAPVGEDANSALGRSRYYNQVDMLITAFNTNIVVTSGHFNNFATTITNAETQLFVATTNSFWDAREQKTIKPIDLDVGALANWSATNSSLRTVLGNRDVESIYVWDRRSLSANQLGAVRVYDGQRLPALGLTVATACPIYVWGHYNQTNNSYLATTNTTTTVPASLVGDAITILSGNWTDANSSLGVGSRNATPTTVNAAFLAGAVDTTAAAYSGGMENFPRFLETWGAGNTFTYNGSMVKMFPSLYANSPWGSGNVYGPPARAWSYDHNFDIPTTLPPLTPSLLKVIRSSWSTIAANQTNAPAAQL
jgi:hypothetical protein